MDFEGSGEHIWQTFTDDDLIRSVRALTKGEPDDLLESLYAEAKSMKWLPDDGFVRVGFFATCHHLVTGNRLESLRAGLIARCKRFREKGWLHGNQDSDERARAAVRACERVGV